MGIITADAKTLMRQASMTATEYLDASIESIDWRFGAGFARQHPELVGVFMTTAALDFGTAIIARTVQDLKCALRETAFGGTEQNEE